MYRYWLTVILLSACNPFLSGLNGEGEPCKEDADCVTELVCHSGYCENPKEVDCTLADCSAPGTEGQGEDKDLDNWGACCDCDDERADVNPGEQEKAYNGIDDDCSGKTSDGDFDLDGHDAIEYGGDDCDDSDFNVHPGAEEICNGMDDDCDTETDEDFQIGEACAGMGQCDDGVWECATESTTVCSTMPGASQDQSSEEICDQHDNDCDGETDEDAPFILVAEEDNEAGDGIDNNCNGLVDEKGGVMVPVKNVEGVWIDSYETTVHENQDCSGIRYGENSDDYPAGFPADGQNVTKTLYACSLPGVIPSGYMSRYRAQLACAAQGKRLCTEEEYVNSCSNSVSLFPYDSIIFNPGSCNDPDGGAAHAQPAGSYPECSANGTFDMSGNLAEWIAKNSEYDGVGFVGGWSYSDYVCDKQSEDPAVCIHLHKDDPDYEDVLKRLLSCPIQNEGLLKYPIETARQDFGGRCCMDGQ